jgi:hypothetical protein
MSIRLVAANSFKRDLKKIRDKRRTDAAQAALQAFLENSKSVALNFETVVSRKGYFTIRTNIHDRILLKQIDGGFEILALGNHDYIYGQYFRNR